MATPDKTLITRAEVTSITDATTGRKAFILDGTTIELGKTGLRDLSGLFVAGHVASGRVLVQRTGNLVTWTIIDLVLATGATSVWSILANTASRFNDFQPQYTTEFPTMQSEAEQARFVFNGSGSMDMHFAIPGVAYRGTISYPTSKAWPTALPGVADGQPVGV